MKRLASICSAFFLAATPLLSGCFPPAHPSADAQDVRLSIHAPDARRMTVAGTFNQWDPDSLRLAGPDGNGDWHIVLPLPPGRYEYSFLRDGADWLPDPAAPQVDDGMGGRNSLLLVPRD